MGQKYLSQLVRVCYRSGQIEQISMWDRFWDGTNPWTPVKKNDVKYPCASSALSALGHKLTVEKSIELPQMGNKTDKTRQDRKIQDTESCRTVGQMDR
ncbi:MAG: hypothetical protein EZS28_033133 [Streblomastix strix]|uniref:Uncharacterized protein n=1 Tax=Streblomastix strix TaxID=222440 RepID=A0A5J4UMU3_9EUKA|nr:MAG: hypothetical protein EZS28_033133 [Streblomastix strix]